MPKLKRQILTVRIAGRDDPVTVEAINPDYLRVERDGPRRDVPANPKDAPMTYMTAVAWAACKRLKLYDGDLGTFLLSDCTDLEIAGKKLDPTPAGVESVSPSP